MSRGWAYAEVDQYHASPPVLISNDPVNRRAVFAMRANRKIVIPPGATLTYDSYINLVFSREAKFVRIFLSQDLREKYPQLVLEPFAVSGCGRFPVELTLTNTGTGVINIYAHEQLSDIVIEKENHEE